MGPAACAPSVSVSPPLEGDFGPSLIFIEALVADDPDDGDSVYGNGGTFAVVFNDDTNRGNTPAGTNLSKAQIDSMFTLQFERDVGFGNDYYGYWESRRTLLIVVTDFGFGEGPYIGPEGMVVTLTSTSNIRNFPPQCAPSFS